MKHDITQKQAAFYTLYRAWKEDRERFLPTWEFVGEVFVKELDVWVLRSYKCPARISDIVKENPGLLERKTLTGKSGARYFGYRFTGNVTPSLIAEASLKEFHQLIKSRS